MQVQQYIQIPSSLFGFQNTATTVFKVSSGKIEGINNKIKTLRRQGYGYPDDDYFFLKLLDASRKPYERNTPSHNFCD